MNETFINISIDHDKALAESVNTIITNRFLESANPNCDKENIMPGKISYVENLLGDIEAVRDAIKPKNALCVNKCKDSACKVNPIGLVVPRKDYKDDNEIKSMFDKMRVVLHDEYDKCVQEGGEGWIKFVDTLATPKERAANYKIPEFRSVYTDYLVDKDVEKISKDDIVEAMNILGSFDNKIKSIIEDANSYITEYNKKRCVYSQKEACYTEEAFLSKLGEAVLIIEEDFINAQSLEARNKALLEQVKNAQKILYALSSYNPRDIRESSVKARMSAVLVEDYLNNIIDNKDIELPKEDTHIVDEAAEKAKAKLVLSNDKFLKKYKVQALKSKCAGIFMDEWETPLEIESKFKQAAAIVISEYKSDKLIKMDVDKLQEAYSSIHNLNKAMIEKSFGAKKDLDMSPAMKKVLSLLPLSLNVDKNYIFKTTKHYQAKPADIRKAVEILESITSDIDYLQKDIVDKKQLSAKIFKSNEFGKTKREKLIKKIERAREVALHTINGLAPKYKLKQLKRMQTQSRAVILKACRASTSDIKEQVDITRCLNPVYEQLIEYKK